MHCPSGWLQEHRHISQQFFKKLAKNIQTDAVYLKTDDKILYIDMIASQVKVLKTDLHGRRRFDGVCDLKEAPKAIPQLKVLTIDQVGQAREIFHQHMPLEKELGVNFPLHLPTRAYSKWLDIADKSDMTVLCLAVRHDQPDLVRLLGVLWKNPQKC